MADRGGRDLRGHGLAKLADAARDATTGEVDAERHAAGRERFERALEHADRAALPIAARWPLFAAAVFALAAALALVFSTRPLTYAVDRDAADRRPPAVDAKAAPESYVRAEASTATARFSDGTEVAFERGARGRIGEVTSRGARVDVEQGQVRFRVVHRARAAWTARTGPFSIQVTGTSFDVDWRDERLRLDLHAGSVVVRGPLFADGLPLRAGQRLVADARARTFSVVEIGDAALLDAPSSIAAPPTPSVIGATDPPGGPSATASPDGSVRSTREPAGATRGAASWHELVARADFLEVVKQAEARGLGPSIGETSLVELAALADAARYVGKCDLARRRARRRTRTLSRLARGSFGGVPARPHRRRARARRGRRLVRSLPRRVAERLARRRSARPQDAHAQEDVGPERRARRGRGSLRRFPGGPFADAAAEIVGGR